MLPPVLQRNAKHSRHCGTRGATLIVSVRPLLLSSLYWSTTASSTTFHMIMELIRFSVSSFLLSSRNVNLPNATTRCCGQEPGCLDRSICLVQQQTEMPCREVRLDRVQVKHGVPYCKILWPATPLAHVSPLSCLPLLYIYHVVTKTSVASASELVSALLIAL